MAKTNGPLFSLGAHGSLSKTLNYSRRRSGDQCRKHNKPTVPATAKQRAQRRLTEFLVAHWQNMSAADKATWAANARGTGLNLSGYHYFLRSAQKDLYTHHGLCGYWHCNEIVGGKVLDLSGNANHATLAPSYPSNAPRLTPSMSSRFSNGLVFDGVDEYAYLFVSNTLDLRATNFTIIIWLRPDPASSGSNYPYEGTFGKPRVDVNTDTDTLTLTMQKADDSGPENFAGTAGLITKGAYHALGMTYDNTNVKLYHNGNPDKSYLRSGIIGGVVASSYRIGGRTGFFLKGIEDEICIYKRALSAGEMTTRYKFALQKVS